MAGQPDNPQQLAKANASREYNRNRKRYLIALLKDEVPTGAEPYGDGWWVVARLVAGRRSASVIKTRLKQDYPTIHFETVRTELMDVPWDAIIVAKRKDRINA